MKKKRGQDITLPMDAGKHDDSNVEWWYCFAFLNGDRGGRYALMTCFFRIGETSFLKGHYLIHSLIDLNRKVNHNYSAIDPSLTMQMAGFYLPLYLLLNPADSHIWKQEKMLLKGKLPALHQKLSGVKVTEGPTELIYGKNKMTFSGELEDSFEVTLSHPHYEAELGFTPEKPVALIGGQGKPGELYYYSHTRNRVYGEIRTEKGLESVIGYGWFDHQWGRGYSLAKGRGWNWFGLQLSDGRELLINEMTAGKNKTHSMMANLIEIDGSLQFTREVCFEKRSYWRSFETNASYPVTWNITIPDFGMELSVEAEFPKQEMPIIGPLRGIWEGAVKVSGIEILPGGGRKPISGRGFMELVGYAGHKQDVNNSHTS
ncbi:lipocalin family protein [Bacillus sp. B-jedd]|uniref:lipocalin family protein n=1 Tax=Bacillus sp. B-jedd TaxID=1476857 RepID=UPI000661FEA9|nr:lipocalin family protein [Bacillus sp. B-jedd]